MVIVKVKFFAHKIIMVRETSSWKQVNVFLLHVGLQFDVNMLTSKSLRNE